MLKHYDMQRKYSVTWIKNLELSYKVLSNIHLKDICQNDYKKKKQMLFKARRISKSTNYPGDIAVKRADAPNMSRIRSKKYKQKDKHLEYV